MIVKLMVLKMAPDDAMASCRLHHQLLPSAILAEHRCERRLLKKLSDMGHPIVVMGKDQYASCVNMILREENGGLVPVADSRKGGMAAGY